MAISFIHRIGHVLPPGLTYLLFKILPFLLLLPGLVCSVLKCYTAIFDITAPAWVYVIATIATHPLAIVLNRAYTTWVLRRDRLSKGALKLPELELSSMVILREMTNTFFVDYPGETFWSWAQRYGNTFMLNTYGERTIFTIEPEDVKTILVTQFPEFDKGPVLHSMGHDLLGTGVFNADGDVWKFHRSMTRPFFSKDRISDFDNFERHATASISLIKERLNRGYPVDFQDVVARFTLDSASEFLFGKDVESLGAGLPYPESSGVANGAHFDNHPSNMFVDAFMLGQIATAKRSRFGELWPLKEFFKNEVSPHRRVVDAFIEPLINEALSKMETGSLEKNEDTGNLLVNLVTETASDNRRAITDELINILVAGRDTTASLLTFAVYSLDRHPDIMRKLREEILNTVGQSVPTYDDFRSMKYLRAVLNETLRLYPAVPFDSRWSNVSTTFPRKGGEPYHVPAYTRILYSVFWMHRRQDLWGPTALKFDPDRFIDERTQYLTSNPFIFLPFNAGPRICLGQQFAYNEASYFLVRLLQSFSSISVVDEIQLRPPPEYATSDVPGSTKPIDTIVLGVHLTMYAKGGLWVTMKEEKPQSG